LAGSVHFLDGGGEMAKAVRAYDWHASVLGPLEAWPSSLKIAVGMMLNSTFPKCIVWGPELITIHNDAFLPILGDKPLALGRPFSDVWSEAWEAIGPIAARACAGEATFIEDFPLVVDRHGYPEQAYFTFCRAGVIADLTCRYEETDRATIRIGYGMELGVHAAFCASNQAARTPFFTRRLEAVRCALR